MEPNQSLAPLTLKPHPEEASLALEPDPEGALSDLAPLGLDPLATPLELAQAALAYLEYMAEEGYSSLAVSLPARPKPGGVDWPAPPLSALEAQAAQALDLDQILDQVLGKAISPETPNPLSDAESRALAAMGPPGPPKGPASLSANPPAKGPAPAKKSLDAVKSLSELNWLVQGCAACPLRDPAKVLGQGPLSPTVMIVLDPVELAGPLGGLSSDQAVFPTGETGQLLTKVIEGGLKFKVEEVYLTRALKCRAQSALPADAPERARAECFKFLQKEIAMVNPKVVLAMGETAGQILTQTSKRMFFLRRNAYLIKTPQPVPIKVTLSPELFLEDQSLKTLVMSDLLTALRLAKADQAP